MINKNLGLVSNVTKSDFPGVTLFDEKFAGRAPAPEPTYTPNPPVAWQVCIAFDSKLELK